MVTSPVTTQVYNANSNQVRKAAADGLRVYVFDARDRLVEVKSAGAMIARFGYDTQNLGGHMDDGAGERRVLLDGVEGVAAYEVGAISTTV